METILFINSCAREPGVSRTLNLCETFIDELKNKSSFNLLELKLFSMGLGPLNNENIEKRDALLAQKAYSDDFFALSRQFAAADKIIVGAPYWDLSFPAVLKNYLEAICVNGITFHYTAQGPEGLSKFRSCVYLSSSGGYPGTKNYGAQYMEGICGFLGKGSFSSYTAEGLDIVTNNVEAILEKARKELRDLAKVF